METKNKILFKTLVTIIFCSLVVLTTINAWSEPTDNPPGGIVYAPINTGSFAQIKSGNLSVGNGLGNALVSVGNVVPSTNDLYDLGSASQRWNNLYFKKGYFQILDPIYKINNVKYSTYVSDMIGLKAEIVGEKEFQGNSLTIDLSKQEKGSDIWLFNSIVKKDTIIPFVSSQSPVALYSYMEGNNFIIKTIGDYSGTVKLSYRLIGERIDNIATSNVADDQTISSFIDVDSIK